MHDIRSEIQGGRTARVTGSSSDIVRIAVELAGTGFRPTVRGDSLFLKSRAIDSANTQASAEWAAHELVSLIAVSANLRFGDLNPIRLASVEPDAEEACIDAFPIIVESADPERLSLWQIIRVALDRQRVHDALLANASGTPRAMFEAYESILGEILEICGGEVGTKEWLIQQGWTTDEEDDHFLKTVLYYGRRNGQPLIFDPCRPERAQFFVRKVLKNFIAFCALPNA